MEPMSTSNWLDELRRKQLAGELPVTEAEPTAPDSALVESDWPMSWPDGFAAFALSLGLRRYVSELAAIARGELQQNKFFRRALNAWGARKNAHDGMILLGGKGAGKSVTALGLGLQAFRQGSRFDFIDAGEFADLWARQDWERINYLKATGMVIIDEIGDCEDIRGPAFGLMKRVINARYRNHQPVILCTTHVKQSQLRAAVGDEIVDRFPGDLRIETDGESERERE